MFKTADLDFFLRVFILFYLFFFFFCNKPNLHERTEERVQCQISHSRDLT